MFHHMTPTSKKVAAKFAAAAATVGMTAGIALVGGSAANADPQQFRSDNFTVVGSDTIEAISNAYAGYENGVQYTPLEANNGAQMLSWNATDSGSITTCITPKIGSPTFYRPNGSSSGRRALNASVNGGAWGTGVVGLECDPIDISNVVDVARSSSKGDNAADDIKYIAMGRDALSVATVGGPETSFTISELAALYSTGPTLKNGTVVAMCGIQTGSGTNSSWESFLGTSDRTGTAACDAVGIASSSVADPSGFLQENKTVDFASIDTTASSVSHPDCDGTVGGPDVSCADVQWLIGFSASAYIAAGNGKSGVPFDSSVKFADLDGLGIAVPDVTPYAPNNAYYAGTYGRDVFYVMTTALFNQLEFTTNSIPSAVIEPIESFFVNVGGANGQSPAICTAAALTTLGSFGFGSPADAPCGTVAYTSAHKTGLK